MGLTLNWKKEIGVYGFNWSTETHSPGSVNCQSFPQFGGELVPQGRLVVAPYKNPTQFGFFIIIRHLNRIPRLERIFSCLNEQFPRR